MNDEKSIAYIFDGTKNGLLTALYESFVHKENPFMVTSGQVQMSFDIEVKVIKTDDKNAERVKAGIIKCTSITLLNKLFYVFRSNDELKETIIFKLAYKCLKQQRDISLNFADADVLLFDDLFRKIGFEVHRMKGFVRFEESIDSIWYAHFEPDNDICDLVARHFLSRLATKFILHDVKRNIATISDGKNLIVKKFNKPLTVYLSPKEIEMKKLWTTYYDSVNIASRKNLKLMKGYMPVRYHKHLPEKLLRSKVFGENLSVNERGLIT